MGDTPIIVRNPAQDTEFEAAIDELLEAGVSDPEEAQNQLRDRFPRVVVRRREISAERTPVWYAYREGHWIPGG